MCEAQTFEIDSSDDSDIMEVDVPEETVTIDEDEVMLQAAEADPLPTNKPEIETGVFEETMEGITLTEVNIYNKALPNCEDSAQASPPLPANTTEAEGDVSSLPKEIPLPTIASKILKRFQTEIISPIPKKMPKRRDSLLNVSTSAIMPAILSAETRKDSVKTNTKAQEPTEANNETEDVEVSKDEQRETTLETQPSNILDQRQANLRHWKQQSVKIIDALPIKKMRNRRESLLIVAPSTVREAVRKRGRRKKNSEEVNAKLRELSNKLSPPKAANKKVNAPVKTKITKDSRGECFSQAIPPPQCCKKKD